MRNNKRFIMLFYALLKREQVSGRWLNMNIFAFENLLMRLLYKIIPAIAFLFSFSFSLQAQKSMSCADLHEGVFFNYPRNSTSRYIDIYEGDYVHETDVTTGDTSLWKIKWSGDCTFTLSLVDVNGAAAEQTRKVMKRHKLVFTIHTLTEDYYTFNSYLDNTKTLLLSADTMWLHEKVNLQVNSPWLQVVPGDEAGKPFPISDTAKYALLYVYRPGKTTLSLSNYLLYLDGDLVGVAKNNSGLLFKVLKEGDYTFKSRLNKDESSLPLHIRFGKAYYIKTYLQWGMYKHLSNYKLQNEEIAEKQGREEFEKIKHF